MELINNIPFAILQLILYFWVTKLISFIKYTRRDYFIIIGIIISSLVLYELFGTKSLLFVVISSLIFLYRKIKFYSILAVLITSLIMYLSNFTTLVLYVTVLDKITDTYILLTIYMLVFFIVSLITSLVLRFLLQKLKTSYLSMNKTYNIIIALVLVISFVFFYSYSLVNTSAFESLRSYGIIFVGLIIFLSIIIFILSMFTLREMRYKRNLQEIETYYEYTLKIESINNEMRKFRHDYVNILSTMSEFIREDDMPGLRQYFNEQIVPMKDNLETRSLKLNGIEKLKVREIKGLITTKILQAQEKEIAISIEVPDVIERIDMNTIELSRIIGITLDNAIEASESLEDALIRIAFFKEDESVTLIIMNKCKDSIPRVHELFEEGFSTKGDNRGLGLSTLKQITDNNDNVLLDTVIENGFFIQKIEIIDKES
ncbi:quorum-sensing sensor histidine kinase AgrC [Staphylococcus warneri]|uniref:quorum-sensing sensor histidine kinase AgrC n=1 Tax=Staphylococcus warneri TaxID=1292 RepID=UPI0005DB1446|nr:GHKL domain-containing protein [Staphylococcus warneri]COE33827.1 Sensor histidine kinase-like protein [Staphylococcus warneri]